MEKIINRKKEIKILEKLYASEQAQFLAVYGRRRIGKTYLIRQFFQNKGLYFELQGVRNARQEALMQYFSESLANTFNKGEPITTPASWSLCFSELKKQINKYLILSKMSKKNSKQKLIIFFDELPWLSGDKPEFLNNLDHFWNSYLSTIDNVILIICGSAASWMIDKVISDKGGLHGRLTQVIKLWPFNLYETQNFLNSRGIVLDQKQMIELYLCFGGVAKYLTHVEAGLSAAQNINQICFAPNAYLQNEFNQLYHSLFQNAYKHIKIIKALSEVRKGINRSQLLKITNLPSGGTSAKILNELEESGFITYTANWNSPKNKGRYRLIDEFSFFYLQWMDQISINQWSLTDPDYWLKVSSTNAWKIWAGFSFETLCLKHIYAIKKALGISGIITKELSWDYKTKDKDQTGAQIDLIIDRNDHCINILEIKFSDQPYTIGKEYRLKLNQKCSIFKEETKTKKTVFLSIITPFGIKNNENSQGLFQQQIMMEQLFVAL